MDGRHMDDIASIGRISQGIQQLNPVEFVPRGSKKARRQLGLIGQELIKVEPLSVTPTFDIDYKALATVLVAYVKDLETRVTILEQNQGKDNLNVKKGKNAKV
jgi:hypothetical protein